MIQKVEEIGIHVESKGIIILPEMDKGYGKFYTYAKPLEISFSLEKIEDMEFQFSRLEKVVESMHDEFKKELDYLKQ